MSLNGQHQANVMHRGIAHGGSQESLPSSEGSAFLGQMMETLHSTGFEACELIVGVDFTKSNHWTGRQSFGGRSLHDVSEGSPANPYMEALGFIGSQLQWLDDDSLIPCYGFGDITTGRNYVFSFHTNNEPVKGLHSVLDRYKQIVPAVSMSGPTTFAPLIRQAMKDVYGSGMKFHVLVILADGQVSAECMEDTKQAIAAAASFPLFIFMVGVGDGPWEAMAMFDDEVIPDRAWDNFQFIEFNRVAFAETGTGEGTQQAQVYNKVLGEVPERFAKARGLVGQTNASDVQGILNALPPHLVIDPPAHVG